MKRVLYIIVLLTTFYSIELQANHWVPQQTPTGKWLYKCVFLDTLEGWAAGDSGIVIHTTNGGNLWQIQPTNTNAFIYSLFFLNPRLGWGVANDFFTFRTLILKTTNGGNNWIITQYPDSTVYLNSIRFLDSLNGWMAGFNGLILQTTNGGLNWLQKQTDSTTYWHFPVRDINFYNSRIGWASGGHYDYGGVIWRTTNYGQFWYNDVVSSEPVFKLLIIDSLNVIGSGGDFEFGGNFVRTTNGGINWSSDYTYIFGTGQSIAIRTPTEYWMALGFSQRLAISKNAGATWLEHEPPDSSGIYDIVFLDQFNGWCVGTHGMVAKYNRALIGISNQQTQIPDESRLYQNYPNPFNPSTHIQYYLKTPGIVRLYIYNGLGQEVKLLLNEYKSAGNHGLDFAAANLPSGIYFYKLMTKDYSETKKMVIVR